MTANYIVPVLGETILVQIESDTPGTYVAPALINTTRSIQFSTNVESDELCDLNDMSAPAKMTRRVRSADLKIDGAGMLHAADQIEWIQWHASNQPKNCKITQTNAGADGGWTITGSFILSDFQISGDRAKSATAQMTLLPADAWVVTANADS